MKLSDFIKSQKKILDLPLFFLSSGNFTLNELSTKDDLSTKVDLVLFRSGTKIGNFPAESKQITFVKNR